MSFYERLGVRRVINAAGKMTALGGSAVSPEVASAMADAAQSHVELEELMIKAGKYMARLIGAEDAVPTTGAAAGIAISVAACIAGTDLGKISKLPQSSGKNRIVLMKGHAVNFGAPVASMIRLGGGVPVEVGEANSCGRAQIEDALTDDTAAFLYVKSHHAVQKGVVSLEECIDLAHKRGIPIIVDAAAEEDLKKYPAMGIDLTCFSGGKAILGPTSGLICGKAGLIAACRAQYQGIGRPMKVGKEAIVGLVSALEAYGGVNPERAAALLKKAEYIRDGLQGIPGLQVSIVQDEAGRAIYRTEVKVDESTAKVTAKQAIRLLEKGDPAVFTRNHYANVGIILVDPRPLRDGEEDVVVNRLREVFTRGE